MSIPIFVPSENRLGLGNLYNVDTATAWPFGTIIRGMDVSSGKYGGGEFIYLPGVASTVAGSLVTYDPANKTTTLAPNTANLAQPVAVALAAVATTANFGWYQIAGNAVVKKTAAKVNPKVQIFLSSTAGRIQSTAASGKEILNARSTNTATVASATSTVNVLLNRPFAQGQTI